MSWSLPTVFPEHWQALQAGSEWLLTDQTRECRNWRFVPTSQHRGDKGNWKVRWDYVWGLFAFSFLISWSLKLLDLRCCPLQSQRSTHTLTHSHTHIPARPFTRSLYTALVSRSIKRCLYLHTSQCPQQLSSLIRPKSVGHYAQRTYFCAARSSVVTVIGKDHDSLSSWWTFNEALFMLQPQREGAEQRRAGPSRRAVWGCKHFEVKDQLRGLITHLRCHPRQPPDLNEKKSKAQPGSSFPTLPNSSNNIRETPLLLIEWSASCIFPPALQEFWDVSSWT